MSTLRFFNDLGFFARAINLFTPYSAYFAHINRGICVNYSQSATTAWRRTKALENSHLERARRPGREVGEVTPPKTRKREGDREKRERKWDHERGRGGGRTT